MQALAQRALCSSASSEEDWLCLPLSGPAYIHKDLLQVNTQRRTKLSLTIYETDS